MTIDFHVVLYVFVFERACYTVAAKRLDTLYRKIEDQIFKIIGNVLKQVFGEEANLFTYKYLEQHYSLGQSEFSEKIDIFAKGLEECLSSGAFAIHNKILEDISSIYSPFSKTMFERKPERYNVASQMKIAIRKA